MKIMKVRGRILQQEEFFFKKRESLALKSKVPPKPIHGWHLEVEFQVPSLMTNTSIEGIPKKDTISSQERREAGQKTVYKIQNTNEL